MVISAGNKIPTLQATFIYRAHDPANYPLKCEVESVLKEANAKVKSYVFYTNDTTEEDPEERTVRVKDKFSRDSLAALLPRDNNPQFYVCGPPGFIKTVVEDLAELGVPEGDVNHEFFGPLEF